jgi:hypothetical protein
MSRVALAGNASGTGTFTIASPNSNSDRTLTLPDEAGTVLTSASNAGFPVGSILQVVSATKTDRQTFSLSPGVYQDITGLSVSITPKSASNKIFVMFNIGAYGLTVTADGLFGLVRGSTQIAKGDSGVAYLSSTANRTRANELESSPGMTFLDSPATTSSLTYKVQFMSADTCTGIVNGRTSSNVFGAVSTISVMEVAA